jgi:hypothetical protein
LLFALPTELPELALRAGFEPTTEVTAANRHRPNEMRNNCAREKLRRGTIEKSWTTKRLLCGVIWFGTTPLPRKVIDSGRDFRPCVSFFGGSNSLLSPPVQSLTKFRVRHEALLMTPSELSRRLRKSTRRMGDPNFPRELTKTAWRCQGDVTGFYATRENSMFMRDAQDAGLRTIETDRPGTGRFRPTHRDLRFICHRAFSYAEDTLP